MKKVVIGILFVGASAFAMTASQGYVDGFKNFINKKPFPINGKFYMYDFEHDGTIQANNWLYIDTNSGAAYQLLGNTPTQNNPFAWKPLAAIPSDLDVNKPSGYFIFINYPQDAQQFGTNAFSWLYVVNGQQMVFKLMGAKPDHSFDYLDENGDGNPDPLSNLIYTINGNTITFHWSGMQEGGSSSSTPAYMPPNPCEDSINQSYSTISLSQETKSTYDGDFAYDCRRDREWDWVMAKPQITVTQVIHTIQIDYQSDTETIKGTVTYNYQEAKEAFKGTYNGQYYDCYVIYNAQPVPKTLSQNNPEDLDEFFQENWADPCTVGIITSTCPAFATECQEEDPTDNYMNYNSLRYEEKSDYTIFDDTGKVHKVHVEQKFSFHR